MSERQEKKARYNQRLVFIAEFEKWLQLEPPVWMFISWRRWLRSRPIWSGAHHYMEEEKMNEILPGQMGFFTDHEASGESTAGDYELFLQKFERKKTTDDCFTPEPVYKAVVEWAVQEYKLQGREIVRPFWPDSDYKNFNYPAGCVVIDNPPFSILSEIQRWYLKRGIDYFLFAPGLTTFNMPPGASAVCVGAGILYANGASVNTSFVTNMSEYTAISAPELYESITQAVTEMRLQTAKQVGRYKFPMEVLTSALLNRFAKYGVSYGVLKSECVKIDNLDSMKAKQKHLFGGGLLVSERAAAERAAAETWELSEREREIVVNLTDREARE